MLLMLTLMLMLGLRSKRHRRVPECFSDHVFIGDAVVGQGLAPHRVQRVVQGLGSKFIGLEDKGRTFSRVIRHASRALGSIRAHGCQVSVKL